MLTASITKTLDELTSLLKQLTAEVYTNPCKNLSNATIGEHTRHIIEMFQCLINQYESGTIDYDKRVRDKKIETDIEFALRSIDEIVFSLAKPNKKLVLSQFISVEQLRIETDFQRELLYNLEHCIHHQALIKVAVLQFDSVEINDTFGIAPSTLEYRKQCVQ